jgi:hypothetical protein
LPPQPWLFSSAWRLEALLHPTWLHLSRQAVQYRVPAHPPPCGHGWDMSARDGLCYPNGYLPPQDQAARQYYRGGGGRYPVPCGHGADLDVRDGQCYPNGTVPAQYQQGRQRYYGEGYYRRVPQGRYYDQD